MGLLRLLFAISVISAHTTPIFGSSLIGGKMAVQAFFMLSGFYMSLILDKKYAGTRNSYTLFITNRILRIFPTYFVVLLLTLISSAILLGTGQVSKLTIYQQYHQALTPFILAYLFFVNIFILGMDIVMYMGIDIGHKTLFFTNNYLTTQPLLYYFLFIPQAWTLSLEMMFYLLAPLLVKRSLWMLIFIMFLSLLLRLYLYKIGLHQEPWTNRFFPTELIFFLSGIVSYRIYIWINRKKISFFPRVTFIILILLTALYSFLPTHLELNIDLIQLGYFGLLFIGGPFIFQITKHSWWDQKLGLLSYPVYISHEFVLDILYHLKRVQPNFFVIEVMLVTLFVSFLLIVIIENPINRYRQRRVIRSRKATRIPH